MADLPEKLGELAGQATVKAGGTILDRLQAFEAKRAAQETEEENQEQRDLLNNLIKMGYPVTGAIPPELLPYVDTSKVRYIQNPTAKEPGIMFTKQGPIITYGGGKPGKQPVVNQQNPAIATGAAQPGKQPPTTAAQPTTQISPSAQPYNTFFPASAGAGIPGGATPNTPPEGNPLIGTPGYNEFIEGLNAQQAGARNTLLTDLIQRLQGPARVEPAIEKLLRENYDKYGRDQLLSAFPQGARGSDRYLAALGAGQSNLEGKLAELAMGQRQQDIAQLPLLLSPTAERVYHEEDPGFFKETLAPAIKAYGPDIANQVKALFGGKEPSDLAKKLTKQGVTPKQVQTLKTAQNILGGRSKAPVTSGTFGSGFAQGAANAGVDALIDFALNRLG